MAKSKILKVCKSTGIFQDTRDGELFCLAVVPQHERQSEKMEVEDLMEKVDTDWKSIHDLLPRAVSLGERRENKGGGRLGGRLLGGGGGGGMWEGGGWRGEVGGGGGRLCV